MRTFLFLIVVLISGAAGTTIRAEIPAEILTGDIDPAELDRLIAENAEDPVIAFDLLGLKAENAAPREAAEIATLRAALLRRHPEAIDADLPALLEEAADLYLEAGEPRLALERLHAALEALRARAAKPDLLAALMRRIAGVERDLGNVETAARLEAEADALPSWRDTPPATRSDDPGFVSIDVYYATDRARTGSGLPARAYGHGRATGLDYGVAEVTIPRRHVPGTVAAPSIWKLEFAEDPTKHVMLQSVTPMPEESYFGAMQADLSERGSDDAFVFVHGYNVSFDSAAKRTAQLAYDMNFEGLAVLYSWPSRGATVGYISDTAVVRLSGRRLTHFLQDLAEKSGARAIHLIAHSMGNRAVTDALELMALRLAPVERPVFDQVIFAAPDVDRGLFSAMLPTLRPLARRMTLYASEQDWALAASRKLHGDSPRAGQGGADALGQEGIDTIDMSALGEDMLAHSYVANDRSAILDISMLFWRNLAPEKRCGLAERAGAMGIWDYEESACADQSLLSIVGSLRNAGAATKEEFRATLRREFPDEPRIGEFEALLLGVFD